METPLPRPALAMVPHPVDKANLHTSLWLLEVSSTQLTLKLAAKKALIIRSSGYTLESKTKIPTINKWGLGINKLWFQRLYCVLRNRLM
ncbi:hypothetical protein EAG18_10420 [Pseudoalteromonas sp. J010]|uniref:hypothetical protein n=1 Tax=Pseudoalteromonas sp. J010 TaxID=998465 RepID=UPI000F64D889|nr:hypothetical protein [Pseudoalteromonas sp. J010]RRS08772.1 hypothetical protein EAG18_10420 [Pseudoalteromonas sp. J010]